MSRAAMAGRVEEGQLIVRIETHRDPTQGLDGDNALLARAAEARVPQIFLRLWWNAPCIVLGRGYAASLPRRVERVGELPVLVRGSGGQVVVHGPGVLQVSLAIPEAVWTGTIDEAFAVFTEGVVEGIKVLGFEPEVGEIPDSYCPGRYDVALAGRKIMGISQRRTREALLVHGTLNVAVAPEWLAEYLEAFYFAAGVESTPQRERITSMYEAPAEGAAVRGERGEGIEAVRVERAIVEGMQRTCEESLGQSFAVRIEEGA